VLKSIISNVSSELGALIISLAVLSIVVKEVLYRWTLFIAKKEDSSLLMANAWHHRLDAMTSLLTIVGVGGTMIGLPYTDPIAGIVLSCFVIVVGYRLFLSSFRELIDGQNEFLRNEVQNFINTSSLKDQIHNIRVRKMGPYSILDLKLSLRGTSSVTEASEKTEELEHNILEKFPTIREVMICIEKELDTESTPPSQCPYKG